MNFYLEYEQYQQFSINFSKSCAVTSHHQVVLQKTKINKYKIKELPSPHLTKHALCTLPVSGAWSLARFEAALEGHWKETKLEDVHREEAAAARS